MIPTLTIFGASTITFSQQRRETDRKYDYRYSVLIEVFARLLSKGWLSQANLSGVG